MNKFKNKYIFIVAILVIILSIIIYSNRNNISELIGINSKNVYEEILISELDLCRSKKKVMNNKYILGAYEYNDTVSSGKTGYCIEGTEDTCIKSNCIYDTSIGACSSGTIIEYQVNDNEIYYFNVLHDGEGVLTLQSINNMTTSAWNSTNLGSDGPTKVLSTITNITKSWNNVNNLSYSLGTTKFLRYSELKDTIDFDNAYTGCITGNFIVENCTSNKYTLSSEHTTNVKSRIMSAQEAYYIGCNNKGKICPAWAATENYWLINAAAASDCYNYGCYGYTAIAIYNGYIYGNPTITAPSNVLGVRPVIEITK